jgi:preprotein translocase subunit YajC
MIVTPAVLEVIGAGSPGSPQDMLIQFAPLLALGVMFYFLLIRPQQKRASEHRAQIESVKRGDTVVLSSGLIGKIVRVEETEVGLEIAQGVTVKVVKSMIGEVRGRGVPAPANDPKS